MMLEVLPNFLYSLSNIDILLRRNGSSIVYKSLQESLVDKKMYLSSMAVLIVQKGTQIIRNYDGANFEVDENEIVLLPKDIYVVSDFVTTEGNFEATVFFIDDETLNKFMPFYKECNKTNIKLSAKLSAKSITTSRNTPRNTSRNTDSTILKIASNRQINTYVESLYFTYKGINNAPLLTDIKIIEFFLLIAGNQNNYDFISLLMQPAKKRGIKKFMEANCLENLKVSDYASLTGRSISTFNREFKRLYGTTPNKWLIGKRLEKSKYLLSNTNKSVTEVSMEVGYENISHFIVAYKNKFGMTPKHHKNKIND